MKKLLLIALSLLIICGSLSGCTLLHETPQTYVLTSDDQHQTLTLMPTITLYENGNAELSQPVISSYAYFGLGRYEIKNAELIITHGEKTKATFKISDKGDTLTLVSSNVGFTKAGSVYKYRSNADYLAGLEQVDGEKLTLDALRELASKGADLTISDFEKYAHTLIDPDHLRIDVEGKYTLHVVHSADDQTSCTVSRNSSGESFNLSLNGSTGQVFDAFLGLSKIPEYKTQKWIDYYRKNNLPWEETKTLTLPQFPDVTFKWTAYKLTAGDKELFSGMPIWNVYLADFTNDGIPEFCATVSIGSGIVDDHIIVYDYAADKTYTLQDRMEYDYHLTMEDGRIMVVQSEYRSEKPLVSTELRLVNGEISGF